MKQFISKLYTWYPFRVILSLAYVALAPTALAISAAKLEWMYIPCVPESKTPLTFGVSIVTRLVPTTILFMKHEAIYSCYIEAYKHVFHYFYIYDEIVAFHASASIGAQAISPIKCERSTPPNAIELLVSLLPTLKKKFNYALVKNVSLFISNLEKEFLFFYVRIEIEAKYGLRNETLFVHVG